MQSGPIDLSVPKRNSESQNFVEENICEIPSPIDLSIPKRPSDLQINNDPSDEKKRKLVQIEDQPSSWRKSVRTNVLK